ncbi:hypothetical protein [Paenibacillus illinoisensis]|uniref:hypothetical protein n=1 Tax=Paenibacillus illinoisensis TaxID=59845 RepID=UPI003016A457
MSELELLLLKMWAENGIVEVYKYKNRIKVFKREGLVRYELFCDLTYKMFPDLEDTANRDDAYAEDCKASVKDLIKSREGL